MKTYKEYLTESKKSYEFKIKIAGEHGKGHCDGIKAALTQFKVESCSEGKSIPIQETQIDFPEKKNIGVTLYDVSLAYPANSPQLRELVANQLKLTPCCVKVRNLKEEEETTLNHQHDVKSNESLLLKDYEKGGAQDQVGETQKMNLLKELNKTKHDLEQYKGVNDEILAKSVPSSPKGPAAGSVKQNDTTVLSKVSNPDPATRIR